MTKKGVITFDLGGTVLDDTEAWVYTAFDMARRTPDQVDHLRCLGSTREVLKYVVGSDDEGTIETFWHRLELCHWDRVKLFDDIVASIKILSEEFEICLFSNKKIIYTRKVLERMEIDVYFHTVIGGDQYGRKPEPGGLNFIGRSLGYEAEQCYYVGDSPADRDCARRAGWNFVVAAWRFGATLEPLRSDCFHAADGTQLKAFFQGLPNGKIFI